MKKLLFIALVAFASCDKDKVDTNVQFPPDAIGAVEVRADSIIFNGFASKVSARNIPLKTHGWEFYKTPATVANLLGQRVAIKRLPAHTGAWGVTYWLADEWGATDVHAINFNVP